MDVAKLVVEFAKVLAWPVTVFILALLFHAPLSDILARLRRAVLKGGFSLELQEKIREAQLASIKVEAQSPKQTSSGLNVFNYREVAQSNPSLALAGLRFDLEVLANNLAGGFKAGRRAETINSLLERLREHIAVTPEQMDLAKKIFAIGTLAAVGSEVTQEQALVVIDLADNLAKGLRRG